MQKQLKWYLLQIPFRKQLNKRNCKDWKLCHVFSHLTKLIGVFLTYRIWCVITNYKNGLLYQVESWAGHISWFNQLDFILAKEQFPTVNNVAQNFLSKCKAVQTSIFEMFL